jgi:hypothetical protein
VFVQPEPQNLVAKGAVRAKKGQVDHTKSERHPDNSLSKGRKFGNSQLCRVARTSVKVWERANFSARVLSQQDVGIQKWARLRIH